MDKQPVTEYRYNLRYRSGITGVEHVRSGTSRRTSPDEVRRTIVNDLLTSDALIHLLVKDPQDRTFLYQSRDGLAVVSTCEEKPSTPLLEATDGLLPSIIEYLAPAPCTYKE